MTLEECEDFKKQAMMFDNIGKLLVSVIKEAKMQQRLTSGMYEAAKLLSSHPQEVTFCILAQNHLNDVARHINYMLMEAFCNEHDIPVIKADCEEKLAQLLVDHPSSLINDRHTRDFSCLLVLTLKDDSETEKLMYLHEVKGSKSIIELPVS